MVVAGVLALALALPTGALFGIGYGTGVRIGYEQIYPLLFPPKTDGTVDKPTVIANIKGLNDMYNAIGGKEASQMGIAVGLSSAMSELDKNPDFLALLKLESSQFGTMFSNFVNNPFGDNQPSPSAGSLSDIDQFNKDTGAEKWARYRTYTIKQLTNIINSSTNQESIRIATAVLNEKLQANQGTGETTDPPSPKADFIPQPKISAEGIAWIQKRDELMILIRDTKTSIKEKMAKKYSGSKQLVQDYQAKIAIQASVIIKNARFELTKMSNQYRDPDNFIRTSALILRQLLADGKI